MLAIVVTKEKEIHQLDINNAFLQGELNEEIYMKVSQGFTDKGDKKVYKLEKYLHRLKQASINWYEKFTKALKKVSFKQCGVDHSLFIYKQEKIVMTTLIYVDDVILVGNNMKFMQ